MYKLQIRDDEGRSTTVPFLRDEVTIGRKEGNTIRLTERNVSRVHARLTRKDDSIVIEDLSRYGVKVNGHRIDGTTDLKIGDSIEIGDYELAVLPDGHVTSNAVSQEDGAQSDEKDFDIGGETSLVQKMPSTTSERANVCKTGMLVALSTNLTGCEFPLTASAENVIGRTRENDLVIDHRSISRRHAKIVAEDDQYSIFDLGSANGIRINDEDYQQTALRRGDIVELGHVKLKWVEPGESFLYDSSMALDAASPSPLKSLFITGVLVVCAVIMGISYFGYFSQPPGSNTLSEGNSKVVESIENAKAGEEKPEPAQPQAQPSTAEQEIEPEKPAREDLAGANAPNKVPELLAKARTHVQARHWKEAMTTYDHILVLDNSNLDAKSARALAQQEQIAAELCERANSLLKDGAFEEAWQVSTKLAGIPEISAYHNQSEVLRKAVTANYITHLIEGAQSALKDREIPRVRELASQILAVDPQNTVALSLLDRAAKRKPSKKQKTGAPTTANAKKSKPAKAKKEKVKPRATTKTESASSGQEKPMSAKELYKAARKTFDSDPQQAIKLYKQAGQKGYAASWRQLGSLYAQQGNSPKAITFWKKYLTIKPGASDAETIRNAIRRHGGQP
jgi:pSer/pThr/pTyr-binding forkhead associated (FHA) protein/tetratricopeptide (TPR) repeat protein